MQEHSSSSVTQRASSKRSPIFFVENVGQFADARIQFQAQLGSSILTVRNKSLVLSVLEPLLDPSTRSGQRKPNTAPPTRQGVNLNLKFVGANKKIKIVPFRRIDTHMSFYLGDNPGTWRADVPVWEGVRLKNIYPKIDLILTSNAGRFTPRLVARKGADVSQVKFRIQGAQEMKLAKNGVQVKTAVRAFTLPLFQVVNRTGDKFDLLPAQIENDVIVMPLADKSALEKTETTLDDDTIYETFFNVGDITVPGEIALDAAGNAFIAGDTYFGSYPDIFFVKLDANGTVLQTTILGGTTSDWASGIAVDGSGNAYVSGSSDSSTLAQAGDTLGHSDGILAKFNTNGDLEWARRVGGVSFDNANGVAVHGNTVALVGNLKDTEDPEIVYEPDVGFVATFDLNGSGGAPNLVSLAESTVVSSAAIADNGTVWITGFGSASGGGCNPCIAPEAATSETCCFAQNYSTGETKWFEASPENLALDSAGNVYMVGSLEEDVAVSRWGTDGNVVTQTFGGNGYDSGFDIATSAQGEIFVVGQTSSTDWIAQSGNYEGFVMGLNSNLTTTWTRANGHGYTSGAAVDGSGAVYITGSLFGAGSNTYAMKLTPNLTTPTPTPTPTLTATATPTPNVELVTLEVFDSEGNAVSDLDLEDGWYDPNPLSVAVQVKNNTNTLINWRADVRFGSQVLQHDFIGSNSPSNAQE